MLDKPIRVTVFKPADRAVYVAQWLDPDTGKKRTKSTGTPIRRDAERFGAKLEKQLNDGDDVFGRRTSWADFTKRVKDHMLPPLAPKTRVSYRDTLGAVEKHLAPRLASGLNAAALDEFVAALRADGIREATVARHLRSLRAMLRWGHGRSLLPAVPKFSMPKGIKTAGGRAINDDEFAAMLKAVPAVVGEERAAGWRYLLRGLWASGLRLGEAYNLTWDVPGTPRVLIDRERPMLMIPGEHQKARRDTTTPIVPEFLSLLRETHPEVRSGFVFNPSPASGTGRPTQEAVQTTILRIGRASGVRTRHDRESYASAHDLRRCFCHRWSRKVLPQVLRILARHQDFSTTLTYYADSDAELTFDAVWEAVEVGPANKPANSGRARGRSRTPENKKSP